MRIEYEKKNCYTRNRWKTSLCVLTGSDQSSGRKQGAGRKAEGKPRLWARLHQKARVCWGTGTVPTRVSLTLAVRGGFPLRRMQTYSTLHEETHMPSLQAFG